MLFHKKWKNVEKCDDISGWINCTSDLVKTKIPGTLMLFFITFQKVLSSQKDFGMQSSREEIFSLWEKTEKW